ncbi:MAG: hypothetical protein GY906_10230 [bacterium]|nr:hypothetical protein [bacterium]
MRYPIYIPSKGRFENCRTATWLTDSEVPFSLVVELPEADEYASRYPTAQVLVLPFQDQGITASRNWIWDHAHAAGAKRHWQFDDDMYDIARYSQGKRISEPDPGAVLAMLEDFTDRYSNVALSGLRTQVWGGKVTAPISINTMVYCMFLVLNDLPYRFRGLGEDTDIALQVLSGGWCTILFNQYQFRAVASGIQKGGLTDDYARDDGRLKRARFLEREWPGLVRVERGDGRPRHNLAQVWRKFDTPLRKTDEETKSYDSKKR